MQTERSHQLVILGACYLNFLQVACIALNLYFGTRLSKDGQFGSVWEHENEYSCIFQINTVLEFALGHIDSIELMITVDTIDIEFSLIETSELALDFKAVFRTTASREKHEKKQ